MPIFFFSASNPCRKQTNKKELKNTEEEGSF